MPYINKTAITVDMETKVWLDRHRSGDESWRDYLTYLLNYWLDDQKRKKAEASQ